MSRYLGGLICFLLISRYINAEITFDGTVGPVRTLTGPDFEIPAELGRLEGNNLFHSFSQFDLIKAETATFSGPDTVQNIIGRITGGQRSSIDGQLRSSIPQADLFLLNPNGFIFGPNARLNLRGSLYLSTASTLQFEGGGTVNVLDPENSVFTSAPPIAFGFLAPEPAMIEIRGSNLSVAEKETLSLSSGKVFINGGGLQAVLGQVSLTGVNYAKSINLIADSALKQTDVQFGEVILQAGASIDVGKQNAGKVFIQGGKFSLRQSGITGNSFGESNGGIRINVESLYLEESEVDTRTFGTAPGSKIMLQISGDIHLKNSTILTTSLGPEINAGKAGDIIITAKNLTLSDSIIKTDSNSYGQGGNIYIVVKNSIVLLDVNQDLATAIQADSKKFGNAGRITIQAQNLNLYGFSKIDNSTAKTGQGGDITLKTTDTLQLLNGAFISAESEGKGNAGNINIDTGKLTITESKISTAAAQADGGNIIVGVRTQLAAKNSEISTTVSGGTGNGGNLIIGSPQFLGLQASKVIANARGGHGGAILITATAREIDVNSQITATSEEGVDGEVKIGLFNINLTVLPIDFLEASLFIKKRCVGRSSIDEGNSTLILKKQESLPNAPDDLQIYLPVECVKQNKSYQ